MKSKKGIMREMMVMIINKVCKWTLTASQRETHLFVISPRLEKMSEAVGFIGNGI